MNQSTGTLFIVSTPIGNLGDLSPRAAETLRSAKYILCESVSHTRIIINNIRIANIKRAEDGISEIIEEELDKTKFSIPTEKRRRSERGSLAERIEEMPSRLVPKLIRYEGKGSKSDWQIQKVIADLQNGDSVALVSNAGTPLISDPGAKLVAAVVNAGVPVIHIPGPAAFVSAAVTSGLPTKNILFIGFLPKKANALKQKLVAARASLLALNEPASLACYISKYQLNKTIEAAVEVFGGQTVVSLARELTKLHEDHFTGPISELKTWLTQSSHRIKGEFTLVIAILT